ncbi:hypothetical protein K490DRAFT_63827 [Saccharata proteae CBS 121410]|uniref:MYND-type domain-containing protein n=1 Tax=Saccharata proteae CBS 121410 TaxID=1314787 RepID=A0A6A5YCR8_9PEZI|nr:hypothetical protein K490DRAFT_63827 [Saccharata proteae CBS 121410]
MDTANMSFEEKADKLEALQKNYLFNMEISQLESISRKQKGLVAGGKAWLFPVKDCHQSESKRIPNDQSTTLSIPRCNHCPNRTTKHCNGCSSGKEDPMFKDEDKTFYCDTQCQKDDWPHHKQKCKRLMLRKRLTRAAEVLQRMFLLHREIFFNLYVYNTWYDEDDGTTHTILEGDWALKAREGPHFEFPSSLVKDERHKKFLLTLNNRIGLVNDPFEDIKEVIYQPRPENFGRVTVAHDVIEDFECDAEVHIILQIKLTSEEKFAIDITGSQFGIFDAVHHWDNYYGNLVNHSHDVFVDAFAFRESQFLNHRDWEKVARWEVDFYSAAMFNREIRSWKDANGYKSLGDMVKLPEGKFEGEMEKMLDHVKSQLTDLSDVFKNHIAASLHMDIVDKEDPHWVQEFFEHGALKQYRDRRSPVVNAILPWPILRNANL